MTHLFYPMTDEKVIDKSSFKTFSTEEETLEYIKDNFDYPGYVLFSSKEHDEFDPDKECMISYISSSKKYKDSFGVIISTNMSIEEIASKLADINSDEVKDNG